MLSNAPALYYALGHSAALDAQITGWLKGVRALGRTGVTAPATTHHLLVLLDEMRLVKDAHEVDADGARRRHLGAAHARAMRATRPGMFEYEIEAELLHEFRRNGAQAPAYSSDRRIGRRMPACCTTSPTTPHCCDGDLVLIDAGCEIDGYAADITRTYPVNGRFSGAAAHAVRTGAARAGRGAGGHPARAAVQRRSTRRPCGCWPRACSTWACSTNARSARVDDVIADARLRPVLHARHRPLAGDGRARCRRATATWR